MTILPLMVLLALSAAGTTSQKVDVICYVFDKLTGTLGFNVVLGGLPTGKCSKMIYVVESDLESYSYYNNMIQFSKLMKNKAKIYLGIQVHKNKKWQVAYYGADYASHNFHGLHLIWDDNIKRRARKGVISNIREAYPELPLSQSVTCVPGDSPIVDTINLVKSSDISFHVIEAEVVGFGKNINTFTRKPSVCVQPLLDANVPSQKIFVGLSQVIGTNSEFRKACKNRDKGKWLVDVAKSLTRTAQQNNLGGVMFSALSTDDYSGHVCGMGKYPLLTSY